MKRLLIIKNLYEKEGIYIVIIQLINFFFRKMLSRNLRINTPLDNLKNYLLKKVIKISKRKIMSGIYKNVYLHPVSNWNLHDLPTKLFGFYEEQIQKNIIEIKKKYNLKNIVNIGAGDGYHIVSLIKNNYFKKGYAFEIDKGSQLIIHKNLVKNKIKNKVKIFDEGNYKSIAENIDIKKLSQTFFLIDIEGSEFNFFNKKNINFFAKSFFIIEIHNNMKTSLVKKFYYLIKKNFIITKINNTSRNPFKLSNKYFDKFTDDERFLLMSEGRSEKQNWLALTPKNIGLK
jgi:hypothetical protein